MGFNNKRKNGELYRKNAESIDDVSIYYAYNIIYAEYMHFMKR